LQNWWWTSNALRGQKRKRRPVTGLDGNLGSSVKDDSHKKKIHAGMAEKR